MSLAKMVVDGWTTLITRRCTEQRFFMRPDRHGVVKNTYEYCLAHAAIETGIQVHAYVAMGNHSHTLATDPPGERPSFARNFHSLFGRIMNFMLGRRGHFFDAASSYNDLHCVEGEDILLRMVYVTTNPVAAGLVERPEDWPGAITLPEHYLEDAPPIVATRPTKLLRDKGRAKSEAKRMHTARDRARNHSKPKEPLPDERQVRLVVPAQYRYLGRDGFAALYRERVNIRLEQLHDERKRYADRKKRGYLGVEQIFRTSVNDAPKPKTAEELAKAKQQRLDDGLIPHIACKDPDQRKLHKEWLCTFWRENRKSYEAFREGKRDEIFPRGTWGMARFQGVRVAET